ncbi:tripartite motif-containing protein 3-like [Littorina saxatilis]|uniref:tripartite motif-containing protein 3-like n=1 Tax=Littorina saxatilis TaxID=31220 RepID=UPI0038B6830B
MAAQQKKRKVNADETTPTTSKIEDYVNCSICRDVFTSPKILSCFHTFCETCLERNAKEHGGKTFPCPICRKEIKVPRGGVSAFRTNVYIKPEDLDKARKKLFCRTHRMRELELFCTPCGVSVCLECASFDHEKHNIVFLPKAKAEISEEKKLVHEAVSSTKGCIEKIEYEQNMITEERDDLERYINDTHAKIVEEAKKIRQQALTSLDTIINTTSAKLSDHSGSMQQNLVHLENYQKQLEEATKSTSASVVVDMFQKISNGSTRELTQQPMTSSSGLQMDQVVKSLRAEDAVKKICQAMLDYLSNVTQVEGFLTYIENMAPPTPNLSDAGHNNDDNHKAAQGNDDGDEDNCQNMNSLASTYDDDDDGDDDSDEHEG